MTPGDWFMIERLYDPAVCAAVFSAVIYREIREALTISNGFFRLARSPVKVADAPTPSR